MIPHSKSNEQRPTRLHIALWVGIMLLLLFLVFFDWNGYQVGTHGDDSSYISMADSLVRGVPYGMLLKPNEDEPTQYPFFVPSLLVPLRVAFPESLDAMRFLPLVTTFLAMTLLFWRWRYIGRGLSYNWAVLMVALTALSPLTVLHARTVRSEPVFLLLLIVMTILVERIVARPSRRWGIWFGIMCIVVAYTRTIGWVLIGAWGLYLFWKLGRQVWRQFALAVAAGAALLVFIVATTSVQPADFLPQEYIEQFGGYLNNQSKTRPQQAVVDVADTDGTAPVGPVVVVTDLREQPRSRNYFESIGRAVLLHMDFADKLPYQMEYAVMYWTTATGLTFLRYVPAVIGLILGAVGALVWLRVAGVTAFQILLPPYFLAVVLWLWNGPRFFYPIQAHIFLLVLLGVYGTVGWLGARIRRPTLTAQGTRAAVLGVTALVAVVWIWLDLRFQRTMLLPGDQYARAAIIEEYVPADAIVVSSRAPTDRLYARRDFRDILQRLRTAQQLQAYLQRQNATYIVTHAGLKPSGTNSNLRVGAVRNFVSALQPLIDAQVLELKYMRVQDDFAIYRIKQEELAKFVASR